ncbi:MAG: 6-hydroxymethylpterin diphosphokinase MptE-like protein, partial [Candidatus Heimdallarchaeaceae archaeon]
MIYDTKDSPFQEYEQFEFSLHTWLRYWYPEICVYLEINPTKDIQALETVAQGFSSTSSIQELESIISDKEVVILAPGSSLEKEFSYFISNFSTDAEDRVIISANGATSFLISKVINPHIIVTDLDGNADDQIKAQKIGAIIVAHIHGDNLELFNKHIERISKGKFLLSTQTNPLEGSFNFLGFTDGDRAICLARMMKARKVYLLGFDFGKEIG